MSQRYVSRLLAFSILLFLALPIQGALATAHGASTGGSGAASDDVPVLVGSGPERETVANQLEIIVASEYDDEQGRPNLRAGSEAASSPERQTTAGGLEIIVASEYDDEQGRPYLTAGSEAEMIRGGLSPVVTEEVAGVEVQAAAAARAEGELTTVNGVRVE